MVSEGIAFNRALQLQPFLKLFEHRGGRVGPVLKAAGLEQFDLSDPATLITGNALYRAVQEMADALGDPYFAARAAEQFVMAGPVFVRESYSASRTLAEFLPLAILEMERQISNIRYSLQVNADLTVIRGERNFVPTVPLIQADAAAVSIWVTLLRMVVGEDFDPSRVLVTAQKTQGIPPDLVPRSSVLERKWNGIEVAFPTDWMRRRLGLDWQIPNTKRGEFDERSRADAILEFIENACRERIANPSFGMNDLARHIGVHPKSLQRTLARLGTSFHEIRDKVRQQRALELMVSDKSRPNEDIAEALGFSGAASFSRAFKRWTGVTPTEFRQNL